jgi:O-antigen ligase/polysaccharide polymerase Wzy-like membrane protein
MRVTQFAQVEARWPVALLAIAVATGILLPMRPLPVAGVLAGLCLVMIGTLNAARLPRLFLGVIGAILVGYAFLGRGFAYLGVPPIYIGELSLGFGMLAAVAGGAIPVLRGSLVLWLLVLFDLWGVARTIPYLHVYGTDALRDAVVWIYSFFAILIATSLLKSGGLMRALPQYRRWIPWFLIWVPVLWWISRFGSDALPRAPGSDVPIPSFKSGDAAVHLAGIAAFLLLGLTPGRREPKLLGWTSQWTLWVLWLVALMFVAALNRGGLLAILVALAVVVSLRPGTAGLKLVAIAATLALVIGIFLAAGTEDPPLLKSPEGDRAISLQQISANLGSVVAGSQDGTLDGSRRWRLEWWNTILDYTVFGDRFWTGKGFGVNLATDDGFEVDEGTLRSPHDAHLTILAREGVPGAVLWILLQGAFAVAMLRAYARARRTGRELWERLDLWILAYWAASLTNMSFDVTLEGPQGGIWFWSLFGIGIAVMQMQQDRGRERA